MTPSYVPVTAADFVGPTPVFTSSDVGLFFQAAAVIGVGVFIGWLLTEAVKLIARYFTLALSGRIKPRQVLTTCLFIPMAVFAGHLAHFSGDPDERYTMFVATAGAVVALLLVMWIETRERPADRIARAIARSRQSSPKPETPTTDAAPTSIHDDWADIAQQVEAENVNAPAITETKPMRVGESREALAAYLGIPNDK